MPQAQMARSVGVCETTVSRVLSRAGYSKLRDLRAVEPVQRHDHEAPGDLLHIDTKKQGRIVRPSHRGKDHHHGMRRHYSRRWHKPDRAAKSVFALFTCWRL